MSEYELQYKPFGERSILIEWPQIISNNVLNHVLSYKHNLENYVFKEKVYIKSAYNSLLITYESVINNFYDTVLALKSLNKDVNSPSVNDFKLWKIPVCYDLDLGIDLGEISIKNNIEISDIIKRHSKAMYQIYFIGFLPGFLYLGGLDKKLHFPRKPTPRLKVEKGSVGIGNSQTGIYPNDSPGGWNIIGKTPINFFDVNKKDPCFAKPGDKIQFVSISREEFNLITIQVDKMAYSLESEVLND